MPESIDRNGRFISRTYWFYEPKMNISAIKILWAFLIVLVFSGHGYASEEESYFPHPWQEINQLSGATIEQLKDSMAPILKMADQEIKAMIPARRPVGSDLSELGDQYKGTIVWTPEKPSYLSINGIEFIPEKKFPPTAIEKVEGPDGQIWEYEYLVSENGNKIYITSLRDLAARDWLTDAAYTLAQLYIATGEIAYAQKAAVIITSFALVVPSYVIYGKPSSTGVYSFYKNEPYPFRSGRWGSWYPKELRLIEPLVLAYDLILPSGVIQNLGDQWGRDLKNDIETGFFLNFCLLIQKYDEWHAQTLSVRTHNMQPFKFRGMIAIGRTIERPDLIHYAFSFMEEMITKRFGLDGVFPESPSYHQQVVSYLAVALNYLKGYSDPPQYIDQKTKRRFDNFDPAAEFPAFEKAMRFKQESSFPDGTPMSVHDTWIKQIGGFKRDETNSRIWPSFGHAVLGRGKGEHQMEAHIDYGYDFSHRHNDTLNLTIWACQEELLSDIGYTYTYRGWATGSLSHNLVVVDGMVQNAGVLSIDTPEKAIGGAIRTWAPVSNGFGVIEAEDINSYPQCSTYRRSILLIEDDDTHTFLVDIFEVAGGTQHDYIAHGSADKDQTLVFNKAGVFFADSLSANGQVRLPAVTQKLSGTPNRGQDFDSYGVTSQYWSNIRKVTKISGPGPWEGLFSGEEKTDADMRVHLLAPIDSELYVGESPSIRRAEEDPSKVEDYMMPIFTARRTGENLKSRYIAIWEPFNEKTWINSAQLEFDTDDGLIIKVETQDTEYTIFWTPSGDTPLVYYDMYFKGRFGVVRQEMERSSLSGIDAAMIKTKDLSVPGNEPITLTVINAGTDDEGDFLEVSEPLTAQNPTESWGILLYPEKHTRALLIGPIQPGNIIRCPEGHGLLYDSDESTWHEKYSPGRDFKGTLRLRLIDRTHKSLTGAYDYRLRIVD